MLSFVALVFLHVLINTKYLIFFCLLNSSITGAAPIQNEIIINEILFTVASEPATARDQQIYQAVLNEVFQRKTMGVFTAKLADDFLLSRLAYKEAVAFDFQAEDVKQNEAAKKKLSPYSKTEINKEVEIISKALALIEIKENQLKEKARFDAWFEIIKRKYLVKFKFTAVTEVNIEVK